MSDKNNPPCPCCKSTNTEDASARKFNGVFGPGGKTVTLFLAWVCNDCGVYFKPLKKIDGKE